MKETNSWSSTEQFDPKEKSTKTEWTENQWNQLIYNELKTKQNVKKERWLIGSRMYTQFARP